MLTMFRRQPIDGWDRYSLAPQQRIVAAAYMRGESYEDIARLIGRTVSQVGAVVSDIRNKLPLDEFPYRKPGWDKDGME